MSEVLKAIGLMSGTSLDGVDAALLDTDGERVVRPGPALTIGYEAGLRSVLRRALDQAPHFCPPAAAPDWLQEAERALTRVHAEAVVRLMGQAGLTSSDVVCLGFHGQTLLHRPHEHLTWQIGDVALLARETGIATVGDFRSADVAAGGQGAPLVPVYHAALARSLRAEPPLAVVNIGGVANVTYAGKHGELIAFDTGPGNAPLDDWALEATGEPMDRDGRLALAGKADKRLVAALLEHEYFFRPPPKSLDRLEFGCTVVSGLGAEDGAATLAAFTAAAIVAAQRHFPEKPRLWIVCGGGRRNPALMAELRKRLPSSLATAEDVAWRGDFIEAEAFAYLAVRSMRGRPLTFPATTGVPAPTCGGRLHLPR